MSGGKVIEGSEEGGEAVPTTNWDESGLGAVELDGKGEDLLEVAEEAARLSEQGVELEAVTRIGSKANPVLVAGRIVGVDGHK